MSIVVVTAWDGIWVDALRLGVYLVFGTLSAYFIREYRRRAARRDHVFECTNDFAVPERCVNCASPHAPFSFVVASVLGYKARGTNVYGTRRRFRFQFCLRCSRRMRYRRLIGALMIIIGPVLPLAAVAGLVWAPKWLWRSWHNGDTASLMIIVVLILFAPIAVAAGVRLQQTSPSVIILDTGEGKLLFRFRSQLYRNFFAELNGEDFKR